MLQTMQLILHCKICQVLNLGCDTLTSENYYINSKRSE